VLLWKSTRFHDENTRFTKKNTKLQNIDQPSKGIQCKLAAKAKGKLTHDENGQKMRCNANKEIV